MNRSRSDSPWDEQSVATTAGDTDHRTSRRPITSLIDGLRAELSILQEEQATASQQSRHSQTSSEDISRGSYGRPPKPLDGSSSQNESVLSVHSIGGSKAFVCSIRSSISSSFSSSSGSVRSISSTNAVCSTNYELIRTKRELALIKMELMRVKAEAEIEKQQMMQKEEVMVRRMFALSKEKQQLREKMSDKADNASWQESVSSDIGSSTGGFFSLVQEKCGIGNKQNGDIASSERTLDPDDLLWCKAA